MAESLKEALEVAAGSKRALKRIRRGITLSAERKRGEQSNPKPVALSSKGVRIIKRGGSR